MNNKSIGIIDSGVGGLSIWQEIVKLLPRENIIYLADQKNFPYGVKNSRILNKIVSKNIEFLASYNTKLVVLACNTATVYTINNLRKKYKLPIVGTVPVIKKAVEMSKNSRIGVISTLATSRSRYQKNLIRTFAPNTKVYTQVLDQVISYAENLRLSSNQILPVLKKNLSFLKEKKVDVLALGCTHYAFIKPHLEKFFGKEVLVLDSAGAIARHVKRVLENNRALAIKGPTSYKFYTTGGNGKFKKQLKFLLNINSHVERIS